MAERIEPDLCIIGGGSGGLSVAAGAVQMGASVVLVEGAKMGGDCLNHGCVPSKALIAAGKTAAAHRSGAAFGITPHEPEIDYAAAKDHVAAVIAGIEPHDSVERFEGLGVRVIEAYGTFISPTELKAGDVTIRARRFVIATGSAPFVPPIPGLETIDYLTNETIFGLRDAPRHLLIIGGGPIGLEMAQAHRRLGADVTVIEAATALAKDDPEIAGIALERLRDEGIEIVEETKAVAIEQCEAGVGVVAEDGRRFEGSHLLMAVGRKPNVDGLGLEAAEIDASPRGIKVDRGLKTSNRRVYAIGDVTGGLQFTHVAGYQAGVVIRSALFGMPSKARTDHIPWATYTDPEIAQVGMTEAEAQKAYGAKLEVLRFDYGDNDRARTELKTTGLIKVMVARGRPVGASIVGPQAGELISIWALALSAGLKMGDIAGMVAPYPTLSELNKRVAGQYYIPRLFENDLVKRFVRFVQKF